MIVRLGPCLRLSLESTSKHARHCVVCHPSRRLPGYETTTLLSFARTALQKFLSLQSDGNLTFEKAKRSPRPLRVALSLAVRPAFNPQFCLTTPHPCPYPSVLLHIGNRYHLLDITRRHIFTQTAWYQSDGEKSSGERLWQKLDPRPIADSEIIVYTYVTA